MDASEPGRTFRLTCQTASAVIASDSEAKHFVGWAKARKRRAHRPSTDAISEWWARYRFAHPTAAPDAEQKRHGSAFSRRGAPEVCVGNVPRRTRGRRESRVLDRTRSLACELKKHTSKSPQVRRNHPAFPARWCYGLWRALPGETGLVCHRLGTCIGAPGPRAFAVRKSSSLVRRRDPRPSHPAPRS